MFLTRWELAAFYTSGLLISICAGNRGGHGWMPVLLIGVWHLRRVTHSFEELHFFFFPVETWLYSVSGNYSLPSWNSSCGHRDIFCCLLLICCCCSLWCHRPISTQAEAVLIPLWSGSLFLYQHFGIQQPPAPALPPGPWAEWNHLHNCLSLWNEIPVCSRAAE